MRKVTEAFPIQHSNQHNKESKSSFHVHHTGHHSSHEPPLPLSETQQKLIERIEIYNTQVLNGIVLPNELKVKKEQFKADLTTLLENEPDTSEHYKENVLHSIKKLSENLVKGRKESLKLAEKSYEATAKSIHTTLVFIKDVQDLQATARLPFAIKTIDFSPKIEEFNRNAEQAARIKEELNEDNALDSIQKFDRLKPKSFDNQCAMLKMIEKLLTEGKKERYIAAVDKLITILKTYIDPEAKDNISDTQAEKAFQELQFDLEMEDIERKTHDYVIKKKSKEKF